MTLLTHGLASSVLTLCALILGALLWVRFAGQLDALSVGFALGVWCTWLACRIGRWWRDD